jgi:hypothetical protein
VSDQVRIYKTQEEIVTDLPPVTETTTQPQATEQTPLAGARSTHALPTHTVHRRLTRPCRPLHADVTPTTRDRRACPLSRTAHTRTRHLHVGAPPTQSGRRAKPGQPTPRIRAVTPAKGRNYAPHTSWDTRPFTNMCAGSDRLASPPAVPPCFLRSGGLI